MDSNHGPLCWKGKGIRDRGCTVHHLNALQICHYNYILSILITKYMKDMGLLTLHTLHVMVVRGLEPRTSTLEPCMVEDAPYTTLTLEGYVIVFVYVCISCKLS